MKKSILLTTVLGGAPAIPWYLRGGVAAANCLAAYQPEGAASLAASYINLANPGTYNAAPGTAPDWSSANGWVFDGITNSRYLDTGITPVTGMSAIVKFSNITNTDTYLFGSKTGTGQAFLIIPHLAAPEVVRYGNGGEQTTAPHLTEGVLGFAGTDGYRNGVDDCNIGAWSGDSTHTIHIGRLNRASPTGYIAGYIKALAIYNTILTPAQIAAITDAIESPFDPTPAGAGEMMIVFMTDTHYEDAAAAAIHEQMTSYIASKASSLGVDIVLHGGDLVYAPLTAETYQLESADRMFDNLDAQNIPYLTTTGNHDHDGDIATDVIGRETTRHNSILPPARFTSKSWWDGGFFEVGKTENAYLLMTIDAVEWLFIVMEFGPRAAVLAWVDGLLTTHADKHAVIVTHSYLHRDGTTVDAADQYAPHPTYTLDGLQNNGDEIWTALKAHDNIRLILSGHDKGTTGWASAHRQDNSDGGVPVTQVVANFQSYFNYGSGVMQFIRINPTLTTITVETYSPRLNMFIRDSANQYAVDWTP